MAIKILIANIGNRNILVSKDEQNWLDGDEFIKRNEMLDYQFFNKSIEKYVSNLKLFTKDLHEGILHLAYKLNILTTELVVNEKPYAILLFSTLQSTGNHQYQDTFYLGELVKKQIEAQTGKKVYNDFIDANPTSEDELFPVYAKYFRQLKNDFPQNLEFVFLDSGGTAQMKNVIKALLDYYFKAKAKIIYQSISKKQSEVPTRNYQAQYAFLNLIEKFVDEFNYDAAYKVAAGLHNINEQKVEVLRKTLDLCRKRKNFEHRLARRQYINDPVIDASFRPYLQKEPLQSAPLLSSFSQPGQHEIQELASLTDLFFATNSYTFGLATYYRLLEQIGRYYVESRFKKIVDSKNARSAVAKQLKAEVGHLYEYLGEEWNIPLLVAAMLHEKKLRHMTQLAQIIAPTVSIVNKRKEGLNTLRNQSFLAHDVNAITRSDISGICSDFFTQNGIWETLKQHIGLPRQNIYEQMNAILKKQLAAF